MKQIGHDETMVAGKIRKNFRTFNQVEKAMNFIFGKGVSETAYGRWVYGEYSRLFPQTNIPVDYSVLDQF